jgi:glycosyltransferase involved in cell wall biosynthesis
MKIALATWTDDPGNPQSWSGIPWHLAEAVRRVDGVELVVLGPLDIPRRYPEAVRKAWYRLRGQRYIWWREPRILEKWTRQMAERIGAHDVAAVFTLGTVAAYCLPEGVPHLVFTDSTWDTNVDYYPTMTGVCRRSLRQSERVDQVAFARADHVVITSEWGRRNVVEHYGMRPEQVTAIPIGANTVCDLDPAELSAAARARLDGPMKLFWIGVEWGRKGGDTAVAAAAELHRRGVPVELHMAGVTPDIEPQPWLHLHGFLNFTTDRAHAESIYLDSAMLMLPTIAEDAGIVFAEAASFAVPSIAPGTGGVPTMVEDGVNGILLREGADPVEYADALEALWADPDRYLALTASSRARYEREMTWEHVATTIVDQLSTLATSPVSD